MRCERRCRTFDQPSHDTVGSNIYTTLQIALITRPSHNVHEEESDEHRDERDEAHEVVCHRDADGDGYEERRGVRQEPNEVARPHAGAAERDRQKEKRERREDRRGYEREGRGLERGCEDVSCVCEDRVADLPGRRHLNHLDIDHAVSKGDRGSEEAGNRAQHEPACVGFARRHVGRVHHTRTVVSRERHDERKGSATSIDDQN